MRVESRPHNKATYLPGRYYCGLAENWASGNVGPPRRRHRQTAVSQHREKGPRPGLSLVVGGAVEVGMAF